MADARTLILACRSAFTAGDFTSVLRITDALTALHPERPEAWRVRAEAFVGLDRHAEALAPYARALELAPQDAALRVRQARALARCGRHDAALAAYEAAFAADPGSLSALHGVIGYREFSPDDPALETVRAIARGAPASPGSRAFACFLLARILTVAGRDDEGFALYATANRLTRDALRAAPAERGPGEFLDWWAPRVARGRDGLREALHATGAQRSGRKECPAVLVAGLPRSGKSLVEHLLGAHPALAAGDEFGGLHGLVESIAGSPEARLTALRETFGDRLAELHAEALAASPRPTARRLIDTAPPNLWDLGYMAALHPEVPVILCRRNPLDLGAAIFFKKFSTGHAWSYDQTELGRMLATAECAIACWAEALPNPVQVVDYEALVADPLAVRDRLLRGLGFDPGECDTSTEDTSTAERPRMHASHSAVGHGRIVPELVGFGGRFREHFAPMLEAWRHAGAGPC